MRPRQGLARILIILLLLRVVAAPVAARPDTPRATSHDRFVVRVCSWPAQRPMRVTTPAVLARKPRSEIVDSNSYLISPSQLFGVDPLSAHALLSRFAIGPYRDRSPIHLSDCPRC